MVINQTLAFPWEDSFKLEPLIILTRKDLKDKSVERGFE